MSYSLAGQLRRAAFSCGQFRYESTLRSLTQEEMDLQTPFKYWSKVIREAEKIVGYPTSFMNLRWLLSDEFANVALHLRKLVGSDHPLLATAKSLLYNQHNNLQPWGLVILLLSKSVQNAQNISFTDTEIYERQRILAELTEMIRTGHLIHKGLINIPLSKRTQADTAAFGNKIGILIGDYLLVTANGMLSKLRNQNLSYIISSALRDLSEGEFFGERDAQSLPLPGDPKSRVGNDDYEITDSTAPLEIEGVLGNARKEWTVRTIYGGASLLGRGCQGAMLLSGQSDSLQSKAYLFGCHVGLAWQAASELQKISGDSKDLSLVSAPVLFALSDDLEIYDLVKQAKEDINKIGVDELRRKVLKTDAVEKTKLLHQDHVNKASDLISSISTNECMNALKNIVKTL